MTLNPQSVVTEKGERVLPVAEYEELLGNLEDLARVAERREEPTITHEELIARLKADGLV